MHKIKLYNNIAQLGLNEFDSEFEYSADMENPEGIVVRSANLHDIEYNPELKAISRAGAGVNNIDLETCTEKGIVVFNTPGANANAVKEIVFAGMLLASRDIYHGIEWSKTQTDNPYLLKTVEKQKKLYAGNELMGKSLGIIGLGAIGIRVANLALRFGMEVYGYDPYLSVDNAWDLSRYVIHVKDIKDIFRKCDFITLHVPLNDSTKDTINKDSIAIMKEGVKILNFARGPLVNNEDILEALESGKVAKYVTDFPTAELMKNENVIGMPHLGASTEESELNCAVKACQEMKHYLKYGNIKNSVNMPNCILDYNGGHRVCIFHKNIPTQLSQITAAVGKEKVNINNMVNKSRGEIAYTILDMSGKMSDETMNEIKNIDGVIRVETYGE